MSRPGHWLVTLFVGAALVGATGFAVGSGTRAAWSYLAGLAIATATGTLGVLLVELAGRIRASLAMIAALSNYALTVLVFLLLLRSVSPALADVPAFAAGLAASLVPYLGWQFRRARPRV